MTRINTIAPGTAPPEVEAIYQVSQAGATDAEIIEALGVMEVFTAFNKFLDVLDVELG